MLKLDHSQGSRNVTIVLRGDVLSTTGYAQVSRSVGSLLAEKHELYFVSLHEDLADRANMPPGVLINDADLRDLARSRPVIVINHTTPDHYFPVPEAFNVGLTAWETPGIPRRLLWPEYMAAMDAMWVPTQFVADFVRSCGYRGLVKITPWPHDFQAEAAVPDDIAFDLLQGMGIAEAPETWMVRSVDALRRDGADIHLAIQSLSPRKGLPVLLSEWRRFIRETPDGNSILLLKLSFRHAHGIAGEPRDHFVNLLRRFGFGPGEPVRVGLISRSLSNDEMRTLTSKASVFVSASYGEGFGLPIVEALQVGTPVIASRHTGIADLLPADYPLQFASRLLHVQLRDLIDVYPPSSSWYIAQPGALASAFAHFAKMSASERSAAFRIGLKHAAAFCETSAARRKFFDAIAELTAEGTAV